MKGFSTTISALGVIVTCTLIKSTTGAAITLSPALELMTKDDCPLFCDDKKQPVCASDGKTSETYDNECFMKVINCRFNNNFKVLHQGECKTQQPAHGIPFVNLKETSLRNASNVTTANPDTSSSTTFPSNTIISTTLKPTSSSPVSLKPNTTQSSAISYATSQGTTNTSSQTSKPSTTSSSNSITKQRPTTSTSSQTSKQSVMPSSNITTENPPTATTGQSHEEKCNSTSSCKINFFYKDEIIN